MPMLLQKLKLSTAGNHHHSSNSHANQFPVLTKRVSGGKTPFPRRGHSAALSSNGKDILLFGGMTPTTSTATLSPSYPTASVDQDGGVGAIGTLHNTVVALTTSGLWTWTNPLACSGAGPSGRVEHTAVVSGKKMIIFGGMSAGRTLDDQVYVLNTDTKVWSRPRISQEQSVLPSGRRGHCSVMVGTKMFVFGGSFEESYLDDLHVLDTEKMQWKQLARTASHRPPPRSNHSMVAFGEKLVVFGGDCGFECYDDVWVFDIRTEMWTKMNQPHDANPDGRYNHSAFVYGEFMYVVGGRDYRGTPLTEVLAYDLNANKWIGMVAELPSARSEHALCLAKDKAYVLGGSSSESEKDMDSIFILDVAKIKNKSPVSPSGTPMFSHGRASPVSNDRPPSRTVSPLLASYQPGMPLSAPPSRVPSPTMNVQVMNHPEVEYVPATESLDRTYDRFSHSPNLTSPREMGTLEDRMASCKRELALLQADYAELKMQSMVPASVAASAHVEDNLRREIASLQSQLRDKDADYQRQIRSIEDHHRATLQEAQKEAEQQVLTFREQSADKDASTGILTAELKRVRVELAEVNHMQSVYIQQLSTYRTDLERLEKENAYLQRAYEESSAKCEEAEKKLAEASAAKASTDTLMTSKLLSQLDSLRARAEASETTCEVLRSEKKDLEMQKEGMSREVATIREQVEKWKDVAQRSETELEKLKKDHEEQSQWTELERNVSVGETSVLRTEVATLESKVQKYEAEMESLGAKVNEYEQTVQILKAKEMEAAKTIADHQNHAKHASQECVRLTKALDEITDLRNEDRRKLVAAEKALQTHLENASTGVDASKKLLEELQRRLDAVTQEKEQLQKKVEQVSQVSQRDLAANLADKDQRFAEIQKQLEAAVSERNKLQETITRLKSTGDSWQSECMRLQKSITNLESDTQSWKSKAEQLAEDKRQHAEKLRGELSAASESALAMEHKVEELRVKMNAMAEEKQRLERDHYQAMDALKQELHAAKTLETPMRTTSMNGEVEEMKTQLDQAQKQIQLLERQLEKAKTTVREDELCGTAPPPPPPPPPPMLVATATGSCPPPPPPPPMLSTGNNNNSSNNNTASASPTLPAVPAARSNLLAEIQAGKKLKKAPSTAGGDPSVTTAPSAKPAVPMDPMARMMAEMAQKRLKARRA